MFSISCFVYVYIVLTLKLIVKQYDSYTLVSCLIGSSDNKKTFSRTFLFHYSIIYLWVSESIAIRTCDQDSNRVLSETS